jgi:hypothetical protein
LNESHHIQSDVYLDRLYSTLLSRKKGSVPAAVK